jgi:hypothetical protein
VAQIDHLPCKCEALSSNPTPTEKKIQTLTPSPTSTSSPDVLYIPSGVEMVMAAVGTHELFRTPDAYLAAY